MPHFENEGALFRGASRAWPEEVWDHKTGLWKAYKGEVPKGVSWGEALTDEEAEEFKKSPS